MAIGIGLGTLIAGIAAGGSTVAGAKMASGSSRRAAEIEGRSTDAALAHARAQDRLDREIYLEERRRAWGHEDTDRQRAEEDRQRLMARQDQRNTRLSAFRPGGAGGRAPVVSPRAPGRPGAPGARDTSDPTRAWPIGPDGLRRPPTEAERSGSPFVSGGSSLATLRPRVTPRTPALQAPPPRRLTHLRPTAGRY